jgi:hypothetical protein
MKNILILTFFLFSFQLVFSQENADTNLILNTTNVKLIKDNRIDALNKTYAKTYHLKGFRVQIYQGNKRQPANHARSKFLKIHPKTKAHLYYKQPHFKVGVGDFRTKLEALKYKNEITDEFPNCFIVRDDIDIEELVK